MDINDVTYFKERAHEILERLDEMSAQIDQNSKDTNTCDNAARQTLIEQAREGRLGSDWQTLQRKIDAGSTTMDAIWSGKDASPEAVAIRGQARRNLNTVMESLRQQQQEHPKDESNPLAGLNDLTASMKHLSSRMVELRDRG